MQVRCLAYGVHTAWTPEESRIKGFLADFFEEFEADVDDEVAADTADTDEDTRKKPPPLKDGRISRVGALASRRRRD